MKTKKYAIVVFTAIAVMVSVMFVAVGSAAINWDYEYTYPKYVLHVTETRLGTWADADKYILHPYLPDDKGRIKTGDGSGGWITHKATLVSGPYKTPREVCPAIEGLPKEKVDIWYPCEELIHPCVDGICDIDKGENCENCPEDCKCRDTRTQIFSCDKLHPEADEMGCYPLVTCPPHSHVEHEECVCDQGYTWNADDTRCVKVKCPPHSTNVAELDSACPKDMILDHHCCCNEGYKLDKKTLTCVPKVHTFFCLTPFGEVKKEVKEGEPRRDCNHYCKQELGDHATGVAMGSGKYPDCCCDCQTGYEPSKITEKCEESCAAQCMRELGTGAIGVGDPATCDCDCMYPYQKEGNASCVYNERYIDRKNVTNLINYLRSLGYDESACPQKGDPPQGSVKFWSTVTSSGIAHSSVVLSNNRQIEMGHKKPREKYGTPYTNLHQGERFVSAILPTEKDPLTTRDQPFTPYSTLPMLCPPPDPPSILYNRVCIESLEDIDREYGKPTRWNCHGFSAYAIWKCVDTGIQVKPGTKFKWNGNKLVLAEGSVTVKRPRDVEIYQGKVSFYSDCVVEVAADKTVIIHIIEGKADYQGAEHFISLSSGQMAVIDPTGVPSAPTTFDVNELDQWWKMTEPSLETSQEKQGLTFESRSKPSGSSVQIPLTLNGIKEKIGNIDITISYDPSVLEATEVIKGGLTTNSIFDYNILNQGMIKISLADKEGFSGDGSIAYVKFNVIGSEGSSAPLRIAAIAANRAEDDEALEIPTIDGVFRVISMEEGRGDSDGDGEYTALDALCALQMAVEKIPEDLVMDMNGDGSVTSLDAREILRIAVGIESK